MTEPVTVKPKSGGCLKAVGIGCLVLLILAGVGAFLAFKGARYVTGHVVGQFTDASPLVLKVEAASSGEADALVKRVSAFSSALQAGQSAPPIELTAHDINLLIGQHPAWTNLAGKARIEIAGDKIHGQISLPLTELGGPFKGRYLNGSAVFRVEMSAGRLVVFPDVIEVRGRSLPDWIMNDLKSKNLAEDANQDVNLQALLQRLETITVNNGRIRIVPRQ